MCTAAQEADERGRGMGHLWVSCNACHEQLWRTMFYQPPHDVRHHRPGPLAAVTHLLPVALETFHGSNCRPGRRRPLPVVSDSGSETGAASRAHVRPGAVSLTALSALISAYGPHQVCYSNVRVVRDEEANASGESRSGGNVAELP
jgi:hypothetical protein